MLRNSGSKDANLPQMWMVSYVVDIALSVTHLGKVIRGHFDLVLGILNVAFKYGPDRIEQKQLRDKRDLAHTSDLYSLVIGLYKSGIWAKYSWKTND